MCFEYFCKEKDKIISLNPTFGMVDVYSKLFGLQNIKINYDKKLNIYLQHFYRSLKKFSKKISMVIVANPNSPTGSVIEPKTLLEMIKKTNKLKVPIIIDEYTTASINSLLLNILKI